MPQVQVVDTTENKPEPTGVEQFFSKLGKSYKDESDRVEIGKLLDDYKENREQANAWEDLQLGLEKSTVSPTKRLQTQKSLNEMRKNITERDKALNAKVNKGILTQEEKVRQKENLIKDGWPEEIADFYLDSKPGVQQILAREHKELKERKIRAPLVTIPEGTPEAPSPNAVTVPDAAAPSGERPVFVDDPITPQEKKDAKAKTPVPEKEWPEPELPRLLNYDQRVAWENENQKENSKAIKETTDAKKILTNNNNRIKTMTEINDGKYLPDGLGRLITIDPNTGDIRPTAALIKQQNPQTALYVKNLNQYLEGIKAQLGSVISDFDIRTFKSQLPSLLNDEQGRRLILKQMEYTNELESVYNNTLNEALKHYGRDANYIQVSKVVGEKVEAKEQELIGKINNLVKASDYINIKAENPDKFRGMTLMQTPKGDFRAVPNDRVESLKEKKWRDF
jgi:hypothetical protein